MKNISFVKQQKALKQALTYCQENKFNDAKELYLDLLKILPNHPQILTNLGTIQIQLGFTQEGIDLLKRSLKIDPWQLSAISNLGNALVEINQHEEAIIFFDKAISLDPKNADNFYNKGRALRGLSNFEEAILCYTKAIELNPNHFLALNNRGFILNILGKYDLALIDFNNAININRNFAEAYLNCGISLSMQKKYEEAIKNYDFSIYINSKYSEAYLKRGIALNKLNEYELAIADFRLAIQYNPSAEAYNGMGLSFYYLKRYEDAIDAYENAINLDFDFYEALVNKATILTHQKKYDDALEIIIEAIKKRPDKPDAWHSRAQIHINLGMYDLALAEFDRAIEIKPNYIDAKYNAALLNLNLKNFEKGWDLYEYRIFTNNFVADERLRDLKFELGQLISSSNKTILIHNEQGVGDQILYLSMIRELISYNNTIIALVDPRLINLFARSIPEIKFLSKDTPLDSIKYDFHYLSGSLGKLLRNSLGDFDKQPLFYLTANAVLTNQFRSKLKKKNTLLCGIAWKSKNEAVGIDKSIQLKEFSPIFNIENINFVDLQYGDTKEERDFILSNHNIIISKIEDLDSFNDIDGLASLIDACDFIVTTSNVTAHIAGGLGKDVYLIVPASRGKIWYWHEGDSKSLWYPSINQFQIKLDGLLEAVMEDIKSKIKKRYL